MKNIYHVPLLVCLLFLFSTTGLGQTLQPDYGAPVTAVSVCDGSVGFKVKVIGSSSACPQGIINISLPAGYVYAAGSATVSAGSGTVSETTVGTNTATLTVLNIPASPDSTVISYQAFANCSAIGTATSTNSQVYYTLNSPCLGSYMATSNTFNTQSAALSITSITNGSYNGAVGDVYTRAITITNNGLGTVSQLTLKDTSGNGFYISNTAITAGWTLAATKQVSVTDTVSTYLLTGPKLLQGQSIVLTQNIRLVNKCYLQTKYNAFFGCSGNACTNNNVNGTATAGATVNASLAPNLKVIPVMAALVCRGQQYAQTIKLANIGTAALYNFSFNLFSSAISSVASTQYFNATRNSLSGGQSAYSGFTYKVGINGVYAALPLDSSKVFTSPGASVAGMPASVYAVIPVIKAGDTLYITYNELNSPLPGLNSGNTMEVSGGLLRYTYQDGCGSTIAPVATFVRNFLQTRMNTLSTVPSNMQQAQTYQAVYNFSESNSGVYTSAAGSTIRFSMVLPGNINFSGLATDVSLSNGSTGVPIATASSFNYNAGTNTINVVYPVGGSFTINSMLNANFKVAGLTLNCAAASTGNNVVLNCYLNASSSCSNEEWMFSQTDKVNFVCPAACSIAGGMNFTGFSVLRTNYGLPDNNNNGVADGTGVIDLTKVKTNYAMLGDTVQAVFTGKVNAGIPASGFNYGYAVDTLSAFNTYVTNLYASIQIYAAGNSTTPFYTCNNLPLSGGTTGIRTVDFSIATLNAIAACPLPGAYTTYNDGDSIVIKINYRISGNIGSQIGVINMANKFYIGTTANPPLAQQYTCGGNYNGNVTIIGNGAGSGTGNLTYSITGTNIAATQGNNASYMGPCCTTAGNKPFGYEYRSVTIYDSMSYTIPPGYDYVSATMVYSYTTGPGFSASKTVAIAPVNAAANPLVFNLGALFLAGTLPYGDQGTGMTATVNIRPNCAAQPKSTAYFYIRQAAAPGSNSGLAPFATTFADTIYLTPANISASAANPTVTTNTNTTSWDVQVSNSSVASATSVWMAKDTGTSGVTITSVQKLSGPGGTVVSTVTAVGGIYQLGTFVQQSNYYRVNATYTNCTKDSMNLAYWYACTGAGYPAAVTASPYRQSLKLAVIPQQSALQMNIVSEPVSSVSYNFCDTLLYTLEILNAGPGSVTSMKVQASVPATGNINFTPGSFQLQYPSVTGTWVNIPDANVTVSGTIVTYTIPAAALAQLDAGQSYRIRFGMQPSCGFASGQGIWLTPFGTIACGQVTSGITQQSQKIQLAGAPSATNLYGITSKADTAAQACVTTNNITARYKFKIVNQGPLPASTSDWFTIQLPASWQIDTNSISYSHNPGGAAYNSLVSGLYNFSTGAGLAVGDSVVMSATLFVPAPVAASIPVGATLPITENAVVRFTGYCSSTQTPCAGSQLIVSTNQLTTIPVAHPMYAIGGFSVQLNTSKDTSIAGTITLQHTDTLYAAQNVLVKLYKDLNANNTVDAADSLLGQQSFPLSNVAAQSFKFNINSPYTAALCPAVLAVADFGCYNVPLAYNCSTATDFYSNGGSPKKIQQCDLPVFNISATDASGKWVLDSGTAVIANRYLPATSVTIAAGDAVRLLWYAYPTASTGVIKIIPDTIRLINNARPVVVVTDPAAVCAPATVDITAAAITAGSTTGLTYTYFTDAAATTILVNANAVATSGTFYIKGTTAAGCADIKPVTVTNNAKPILIITNPPVIACSLVPVTVDLTAAAVTAGSTAGLSFGYYTDAAGTITLSNPNAVATGGTYYIMGTNAITGCTSLIMPVTVIIDTKPTLSVSASAVRVCEATAVTLSAISPGNSIVWLETGSTSTVTVYPVVTTTYSAVATAGGGCTDTASITVDVINFKLDLSANTNPVLAGTNTTLTTSANYSYNILSWSPSVFFTNQTTNSQTIMVKDSSKTFTVIGRSVDGCLDTATLKIMVDPNLKDFFIPNAFTPNNDGRNDVFKVYGSSVKELHLLVFNQWGQKIFETSDLEKGWNGTFNGNMQSAGAYIYTVKAVFYNGTVYTKKGTFNLIR